MLDYPLNLSGAKHLKVNNRVQTMENETFENPANQSSFDSSTECLDNCEFHNHQAQINDFTSSNKRNRDNHIKSVDMEEKKEFQSFKKLKATAQQINYNSCSDKEDCSQLDCSQQSETDLQLRQVDDPDFDQLAIGYNNSLTEHFIISEKLLHEYQLDHDENASSFRLSSNELSFLLETLENNCESLSELSSIEDNEMNMQGAISGEHEPDETEILRKTVEELNDTNSSFNLVPLELQAEQKKSSMNVTDLHELHNFKIELDTSKLMKFGALFPKEDTASCYL
ncbi:uncharacterized protein LOC133850361 [Drosophila sulfurigaster albostrigata]|uniref:uncharacterized protein LOC133850361 n=1 Tax=Drosophila sulfurigaster albostrigata TaxID=89887 RepID=UPI002D21D70B|nr:uncharacterized protein LOC133850361 [Drosophila sulfurigaster albostrigata]XP_062142412.1 uncharacterized protein LOC133850361 [Drosophila sulfurigaster albostrigata]